ncbi:hypothetical protein ACW9KT_22105 [Hymenobacter sp. HD11105]
MGRILEHPQGYARVEYHAGARDMAYLQAYLRHVGQLLQLRGWHKLLGDQRQLTPYTPEESQLLAAPPAGWHVGGGLWSSGG